jgi:hypothetical protein
VKTIISRLLTIQDLQLQSPKKSVSEVQTLREQVPSDMLVRFDKFLGRGKKGVALVQNSICKGCQIAVPPGTVNSLIQGVGAQICGNCGRYLYLAEADAVAFQGGLRSDTISVTKPKVPTLRAKPARAARKTKKVTSEKESSEEVQTS